MVRRLVGCEPRQRIQVGLVVTVWYTTYLHLLIFLISKQNGEGDMSRVVIFVLVLSFIRIFILYLLLSLCNYVEHNQPLFGLALSCFFTLILILCAFLNLLYFPPCRLES